MLSVKVDFENGDVIKTRINGSNKKVAKYYAIGREFNLGVGGSDNMQKVTGLKFVNNETGEWE